MTVEISEITDISQVEPNVLPSTMFVRDNLEIMRGIDSECIDLIYLDPPFNSKHNYAAPIGSEAAGAEFKDMWSLDDVDAEWISMIASDHPTCTLSSKLSPTIPTNHTWRIWRCDCLKCTASSSPLVASTSTAIPP